MDPADRKMQNDPFSDRRLYAAGGALLILAGWLLTSRLRTFMDIFFLDETGYLVRGMNMFPKIPKLWGPVYCLWYRILSVFEGNALDLFFLNFGLISVLFAVVLYLFLLRFRAAWPAAVWLAFMVLIAPLNLPTFPKVSHFAAMAAMVGLMAAYSVKSHQDRYLVIALLFLVLSYIRPEFYLSFLVCSAGIAAGWITGRIDRKWSAVLIGGLVLAGLLHIGLGMPLGVELRGYKRSFIAFGEHFSWNYSKWNDLEGYLWLTWESVTASQFGDARSFSEAFRANPGMMFRHILFNTGVYFDQLGSMFATSLLPLKKVPAALKVALPVLVVLAGLLPGIRTQYLARLRHHRALLVFLILLALPSMISCLLVFPREHYLVIQLPLLIWLLAELLSTFLRAIPSFKVRGLVAGVLGLLAVVYFIDPRRPADYTYFDMRKENGKLNNLNTIALLDANASAVAGRTLLSHEGDFSAFTKARIDFINAKDKEGRPFSEFLAEVDPDMIYCTQTIFRNPEYLSDQTWSAFIAGLETGESGWRFVSVGGGQEDFLLVRPDLFDQIEIEGNH